MTTNNANTANQTDIFSLFGIVDDLAEMKKKEEAERKAKVEAEQAERAAIAEEIRNKAQSAIQTEKAPEKKVEVVFAPNEDTVIRYFGESHAITSYFTPEELAEGQLVRKKDSDDERMPLTPELLRKRMEKDFPELVKDHTEMIYLQAKNLIVPMMKAKKKGNCTEVLYYDNTSHFPYKIPFALLAEFVSLAKIYGLDDFEIHGDIYFSIQTQTYFLDIPKQTVHKYWIEVTESALSIAERIEDSIKVMEIHSHHSMNPTPSEQDNVSETLPGMHYAIIGNIEEFLPNMYVRKYVSEAIGHITIDISSVFECPFVSLPTFNVGDIEVSFQ